MLVQSNEVLFKEQLIQYLILQGILKKASSNPALNRLETGSEAGGGAGAMSEAGATISEVITVTL